MTDCANIINHSVCLRFLSSANTDPALLIINISPHQPSCIAVFQVNISIFCPQLLEIKFEVRQDRGRCWDLGMMSQGGEGLTETRESKTGEREGERAGQTGEIIITSLLTLN